jgi:glycosyltransferase involved in cell wall biosynthesis
MELHLSQVAELMTLKGLKVCILQRWTGNETIHSEGNLTIEGLKTPDPLFNYRWRSKIRGDPAIVHLNNISHSFPSASTDTSITFHGVGWDIPKNIPREYSGEYFDLKVRMVRSSEIFQMIYGMKRCKKILTVDTSILRLMQQLFPEETEKVHYIPNYVDTNLFRSKSSTKEMFELSEDDYVILFPRNISLARGYPILLDILNHFSKDKKVKILVAGRELTEIRKSGYLVKINEYIQSRGLSGSIRFLGSIEHRKMVDVYNAADVVIIPSLYSEGTSLSAIEGMASGKPVITSNVGGLNDLIIDGYNGLIRRPRSDEFITAIEGLRSGDIDPRKISENASAVARQSFTKTKWDASVIKFFDL